MKRFTDAGRRAIADGNLYAAITMALMLPDICGGLERPRSNHEQRYTDWCDRWLIQRLTRTMAKGASDVFLSSMDCYRLRCRMIHDGRTEIKAKLDGRPFDFEICDQTYGSNWNRVKNKVTVKNVVAIDDNYLQLKADIFSTSVFDAVDAWDEAVSNDTAVQAAKKDLLYIRSRSDPPRSIGVFITPGPKLP